MFRKNTAKHSGSNLKHGVKARTEPRKEARDPIMEAQKGFRLVLWAWVSWKSAMAPLGKVLLRRLGQKMGGCKTSHLGSAGCKKGKRWPGRLFRTNAN